MAPLLQPGSGSAFWYLALKNWVIASGIRPRVVVFFRDTNLTDVMFRLDEQFRGRSTWRRSNARTSSTRSWRDASACCSAARRFVDEDRRRRAGAPRGRAGRDDWPASDVVAPPARTEFMTGMNERLGFDHLRPMEAADIQVTEGRAFDFDRDVDESVLPLMLRDAKRAGLTLAFVRVQRRPTANRPPAAVAGLRRYVDELRPT